MTRLLFGNCANLSCDECQAIRSELPTLSLTLGGKAMVTRCLNCQTAQPDVHDLMDSVGRAEHQSGSAAVPSRSVWSCHVCVSGSLYGQLAVCCGVVYYIVIWMSRVGVSLPNNLIWIDSVARYQLRRSSVLCALSHCHEGQLDLGKQRNYTKIELM